MENSHVSLTKALKSVFDEQQNYDVTFLVDEEDIHAHKFILSVRSSVFKAMINNPISYFDGKIHISDPLITPTVFKNFLKFLYTDECEIKPENLEALLHLGNMYDVPLLMENCAEFVETNLNASNLLEYAEIGLIYADNCSILSKCLKRIPFYFFDYRSPLQNPPIYYYSPDFSLRELSSGLVLKIVQDSNRIGNFTEEKLFEAVLDWAQEMCLSTYNEEAATMSTNMKEILKDIIPFIKFEKLKPLTLATNVKEYDLLSTEDQLDALQKSVINQTIIAPKQNSMASLNEALKNVLNELKNADVTFTLSNEEIYAHKLILSARSSVMKVMIENPMAYVNGKILITDPDVASVDFKVFIKFLYTDECEITEKNFKTMLHLANLLEYAEIGLLYSDQCRILTECLMKIPFYFFYNPPNPLSTPVFSLVRSSSSLVFKIVQDVERINGLTEEKLFKVVMEWANQICLSNSFEPNPSNLKEALMEIIPFIKFENLKPITMVEKIWENNLVPSEEYIKILHKSIINNEASSPLMNYAVFDRRDNYSPADSMYNNYPGFFTPIPTQNFIFEPIPNDIHTFHGPYIPYFNRNQNQ